MLDKTYNLCELIDKLIVDINAAEFNGVVLSKTKLAMMLMLLNMALRSVPRSKKLFDYTEAVEDRLFDVNRINDCHPVELMELYKLSINRQAETNRFIATILNSTKWNDLDSALQLLAVTEKVEIPDETRKQAHGLINLMNEIKTSHGIGPIPESVVTNDSDNQDEVIDADMVGIVDE